MSFIMRVPDMGILLEAPNNDDTFKWNSTLKKWEFGPSAGAGVTSVFGRTGAVIANTGDYDSDQITNHSGVAGGSVTAALNTLNAAVAGFVPTSRTLTGTSPIQIDGGASADLSANRTISVLQVTNTNAGVVPQTGGTAGQALLAGAGAAAPTWGTDFVAQNLTTTGFIGLGATPRSAALGLVRVGHGVIVIAGRNQANGGDRTIIGWGTITNDGLQLGDVSAGTYRILSSGQQDCYIGATRQYSLGIALTHFNPDATANWTFSVTGVVAQQFYAVQTGTIRNISYFATVAAAGWNSANRCFYVVTALQNPIAAPTGGAYWLADSATNALIWHTAAGVCAFGNLALATIITGIAGSALVGTANCLRWDTNKLGLYNSAPVALQTVTGSRAANAALADLLTKLATLGAIVDGTTV